MNQKVVLILILGIAFITMSSQFVYSAESETLWYGTKGMILNDQSRNTEIFQRPIPDENGTTPEGPFESSNSKHSYINSNYKIKIDYSSNWIKSDMKQLPEPVLDPLAKPVVSFTYGRSSIQLTVYVRDLSNGNVGLDDYFQTHVNVMTKLKGVANLEASSASLANLPAKRAVYTNHDGTLKMLQLCTLLNNRVYIFIYSTPVSQYNIYLSSIHTMLNSVALY